MKIGVWRWYVVAGGRYALFCHIQWKHFVTQFCLSDLLVLVRFFTSLCLVLQCEILLLLEMPILHPSWCCCNLKQFMTLVHRYYLSFFFCFRFVCVCLSSLPSVLILPSFYTAIYLSIYIFILCFFLTCCDYCLFMFTSFHLAVLPCLLLVLLCLFLLIFLSFVVSFFASGFSLFFLSDYLYYICC